MQSQDIQVKSNHEKSNDWKAIASLLPYLWTFKGRVILALSCLIAAKVANLGVPILLKFLVDSMSVSPGLQTLIVVPVALIIAYGLLRLSASLFTELRELIFSRVTESAVRTVALQVFEHLHALSLRFHLSRQTGGMTRDIERGTRGIQSLISYSLYSILPTMVELGLVLGYFVWAYNYSFALITLIALVLYVTFTIVVTEWRTKYRKRMNELDSKAHQRAVDALINFEVLPGKTTAVVGHSGAGKSTLARLLFRFYDVTKGSIEFDQQNIQAVSQKSLRACIGIVPQDTVLFNDTIAYNIAYGRPGASQEEIETATKAAQIHDFITSLPDGYKSAVGERGLKLSGGEKQRVAIARTLLKNPSFLIFDEATSALDSETERAIQKELMALAKNRSTLLIVYQRLFMLIKSW